MKILHAIHGFLPQFRGGTELYLFKLAREQRAAGHEVEIVTGTTDFADKPRLENYVHDDFRVWKIVLSGAYLEHWTRSMSPDGAAFFAEVVKKVQPDIVHVQHWHRLSRNLIETCYRLGVPAVCTLHDLWLSCPRIFRIRDDTFCERPLGEASCTECVPRLPWMEDAPTARQIELFKSDFLNEIRLASRIIVPSQAHGALVRRMMDVPQDRFLVLPHGTITEAEPAERSRPRPRLGNDRGRRTTNFKIGMWGHLLPMKGAHLVLEALHEVPAAARFETHIWGKVYDPEYKKRLERLSEGLNVTWHGAFEPQDIRSQPLDLAIIPSICSESFSFVLDESFRLGLPAIVSDRGALAERVGKAGATFAADDPAALARVLNAIVKEPELIDQWRRHIPELLGMSRHSQKLCEVYRDVITAAPDVTPDYSLPQRRERELAALLREAEQLMFAYLGHIKRESGRGDHYEGVVKKMIDEQHAFGKEINDLKDRVKVLDADVASKTTLLHLLAREIADFREAMVLVHQETPRFGRQMPKTPEVAEHVPGLGGAQTIVSINHEIMQKAAEAVTTIRKTIFDLRERMRERESRVDELTQQRREQQRKIDDLAATLTDREKRITDLTQIAADRERRLEETAMLLKDRDRRLAETEAQRAEHEARAAECAAKYATLETAVEAKNGELESIETRLRALAGEHELSRERAEDLAKRGEEHADRIETLSAAFEERERRIVDLASRLTEESERARATREAADAELAAVKAACEEWKTTAEAKTREVEFQKRLAAALAGLVDTLRKAMIKVNDAEPTWHDTTSGIAKDLRDCDLANLGKLGDASKRVSEAVREYMSVVKRLKKDAAQTVEAQERLAEATRATATKDEIIAHLSAFIEDLRRALTMIFMPTPELLAERREIKKIAEHVPGLGDLETVYTKNIELIQQHLAEVTALKSALRRD